MERDDNLSLTERLKDAWWRGLSWGLVLGVLLDGILRGVFG